MKIEFNLLMEILILAGALLTLEGVKCFFKRDTFQKLQLQDFFFAVLSFFTFINNTFILNELKDGLSVFSPFDWLILIVFLVSLFPLIKKIIYKQIDIHNISKQDLFDILDQTLTNHNISHYREDDKILLNNHDSSIEVSTNGLNDSTFSLKFRNFKDIYNFHELQEDLSISAKRKTSPGFKYSGLIIILMGIGFMVGGLKYLM